MTALRLGRLSAQIDGDRIVLAGRIDDSTDMDELIARLPGGPVAIDTSAVAFVSSVGMREWMRLVRALHERGQPITFVRVADVLITQMNMIPELARAGTVVSFHAQYVCPACAAESVPVVDAVAHAQLLRQMRAPSLPCPECGAAMELADFPERYLTIFRG